MITTLIEFTKVEIHSLELELEQEMDTIMEIHEERPDLKIEDLLARSEFNFQVTTQKVYMKKKMISVFENIKKSDTVYEDAQPTKTGADK